MGFFNSFSKSSSTSELVDFWRTLESDEDVDTAISHSTKHKIIIFKHSTRCPISRIVLKRFEDQVKDRPTDFEFWFLDLLKYRSVSNYISYRLDVEHQSPQMIVVCDSKVIHHSSHQSIDLDDVK